MGDVQEVQLHIRDTSGSSCCPKDAKEPNLLPPQSSVLKRWRWWLKVSLYTFFILAGQTVATLLGRFYFNQGGNSKWMQTIVTSAGFPVLFPPLLLSSSASGPSPQTTIRILTPLYIALGIIVAIDNLMYSYGLLYLPVSTFSLVCATQLAFNAVFSYFLNSQKFTALIFNSVVLVTFSAALLGVSVDSDDSSDLSKGKYPLGFILTLGASAVFSLLLSLTQLIFQKVLKTESLFVVMQQSLFTGLVATVAAVVGLFASGEWRGLRKEMAEFGTGEVSYIMTLVWTAVCWQVTGIGLVGLAFAVSSLFSNMICTLGLPLVPVFAVVFFHDRMDGVKVMAMLIAIWGFLSFIYQDYLDCSRAKNAETNKVLVHTS